MKKSVKTIIAIVAVVALVASLSVAFAACGNEPDGNSYPNGIINVGCTIFDPMYYIENDKEFGFDYELAQAVFSNLGYKANFKVIDWSNKYTALKADEVDCLWNGFTSNCADSDDNKQRSEKVDFSIPYMKNFQAVVVKGDDLEYANFEDFTGACAVEGGSAGESFAANFPNKGTVNAVGTQTDALNEVKSGSANFAIVDILLANTLCEKGNYSDLKINKVIKSSDAELYAIGFKKGSDLTAKVNDELVKLLANGTIKQIAEKYALDEAYIKDYTPYLNK